MEQFQILSEPEKSEVIMQGTFLADREENGLVVQLYNVGSFYGEVYYDQLVNRILRYRVFEGIQQLTPYLAHINFNLR